MDAQRRRYSVEELRALRDRAPPLPLEAILRLGTASRSRLRHREPSPPRPPSPILVPVDDSWLRPHPLLDDLDASLEPARSPPRSIRTHKQPKQPSTPPPGFGPAPGFGPVPSHPPAQSQKTTRTGLSNPPRAPSPPAAAHYKSRIARGPDLSRNFASRIAFRDKAKRQALSPPQPEVFKAVPSRNPLAQKPHQNSQAPPADHFTVTQRKPAVTAAFVPIEACHASAEIDRLFAAPLPSSPLAQSLGSPRSQSHLSQQLFTKSSRPTSSEQSADALARWFRDLSTHTSTAYSSEADKNAHLHIVTNEASPVNVPLSVQKDRTPPVADEPLAPNVLSFFDSIRAQATTAGRKSNVPQPVPLPTLSASRQGTSHTHARPDAVPQTMKPQKRDDGIDSESVRSFFDMFSSTQSTNGKTLPHSMAQPSNQARHPMQTAERTIPSNLMHAGMQSRNQPLAHSYPQSHILSRADSTASSQVAPYSQAVPQSRHPQMSVAPAYPPMIYHAQHSRAVAHSHAAPTHALAQATHAPHVHGHSIPRQNAPTSGPMHGTHGPFVLPHQAHAHGLHPHNMPQRSHATLPRHPGHAVLHQQQHGQMQHIPPHMQHLQQRQHAPAAALVPNGGMARFQHVPSQQITKAMPVPIGMGAATTAVGGAAATPPRNDAGDLQRWFAALSDANQTH